MGNRNNELKGIIKRNIEENFPLPKEVNLLIERIHWNEMPPSVTTRKHWHQDTPSWNFRRPDIKKKKKKDPKSFQRREK